MRTTQVKNEYRELMRGFREKPKLRQLESATKVLQKYGVLREKARWQTLYMLAEPMREKSNETLEQYTIASERAKRNDATALDLESRLNQAALKIKQALKNAKPKDIKQFRATLKARCRSDEKVDKIIETLNRVSPGVRPLRRVVTQRSKGILSMFERSYVLLRVYAGRSTYFSAVNLAPPKLSERNRRLEEIPASAEVLLEQSNQSLYQALRDSVPREEFVSKLKMVLSAVEALWEDLGRAVGYLVRTANVDRNVGNHARLVQALRGAEAAKRLELLTAYCSFGLARSAAVDADDWYTNEIEIAKARPLDSKVPMGIPRDIAELANERTGKKVVLIQIEGLVTDLHIAKAIGSAKFSSIFNLINAQGDGVLVRAHMFSLKNNGLKNGAYTRINARCAKEDGAVIVDIDRVNLTELQRSSWLDSIAHRMRHYVRIYMDEMNMFFTPPIAALVTP